MADEHYKEVPVAMGPSQDAKTWAMLCHLAALAGYVVPFGNVIGPLVAWQIKKDSSEFVDYNGKESLNFQITVTLAIIASIPLVLVLIGILMLIVIPIAALVLVIIAGIKAGNGEVYRYPMTIRLIK
jgi:uncharacterized Tic20 family protein